MSYIYYCTVLYTLISELLKTFPCFLFLFLQLDVSYYRVGMKNLVQGYVCEYDTTVVM